MYRNTFECAPVEVTYVPPRPKRRSVQVALTATVTGPPGEEIHVDALGQIKVQFHRDREGGYDERSSCWIRVREGWWLRARSSLSLPPLLPAQLVPLAAAYPA